MNKEELQQEIDECRDLLESKGETCPVYVGFDKDSYSLTQSEMYKISKCLYLIDCELNQNKEV